MIITLLFACQFENQNNLNIKYFNSCIDRSNQKAHNKLELKSFSANKVEEDLIPILNKEI